MKITRRQFLKGAMIAGAGFALPALPVKWNAGTAHAYYESPGIPLFGTTLRGVGPGGIPVAVPGVFPAPVTGVTHYVMGIIQFQDQIVPPSTGLGKTALWGFAPSRGLGNYIKPTHLSGLIVAQKNQPIQITFQNLLFVNKHIIPVDTSIPGANQQINRTAVHMHGGLVPWISDGGPFDWFDAFGRHGLSFLNNKVLNPFAILGGAEYYYPMNQSARFLWYHDHAIGITRINAYAGIASGVLLRDTFEANLINQGLPNFVEAGGNEIPLVIQDKIFVGPDINQKDPLWSSLVQRTARDPGSLWYPHTYDPARWELAPGGLPLPEPSCVPEFFGDTMLVNGTTFPQATVQARRYRLRLLNACNARFLNLQLYVDDGSPNGISLGASGVPTNAAFVNAATGEASWLQIGTEGGFLSKPAKVPSNVPIQVVDDGTGATDPSLIQRSLVVAPAERPDVIVDFSGYAGQSVILYSDAPAPYPFGDPLYDFFPGLDVANNPVNGTTQNGFGPNTRVLMRFNVVGATGPADPPLNINTSTDLTPGIDPFLTPWGETTPPPGTPRFLTLMEAFDVYGRLIQIIGDDLAPLGSPLEGTASYINPARTQGATEQHVNNGATEVWEIYNATGDMHPMHFHLVNVQVINRQRFDLSVFPGSINFTGPVIPPDDNELGWKETVPMYPGTVTRVIMKFDLSDAQIVTKKGKIIPTPPSPRTGGNEYVWHCHILEHEEHDMMHALVVG
ncbi:MAG: multicopper oxidase domain-containing protein [Deltaproteobacteria bacterium]